MERQSIKISIIIPVYNVELYIEKCLSSIVNQTFKNIEIIIIIDGSTDKSEEICEEFAKKDRRIKILKQENQGLSSARNRGLENMTGDYVMFVDGDDFVLNNFCELPYEAAKASAADVVVFGYCEIKNKKAKVRNFDYSDGIIDKEFAIDHGSYVVWNKLYLASLFEGVLFPDGYIYEDIFTTPRLIMKAQKIYWLNRKLYCHVFNPKSISNTATTKNIQDYFVASVFRFNELISKGYPQSKAERSLFLCSLSYISHIEQTSNDSLYQQAVNILVSKKGLDKCDNKHKCLYWIWKTNKPAFHLICKLFNKRIKNCI